MQSHHIWDRTPIHASRQKIDLVDTRIEASFDPCFVEVEDIVLYNYIIIKNMKIILKVMYTGLHHEHIFSY